MKKHFLIFLFSVLLIVAFTVSASASVPITTKDGETIDMTELFEAKSFTSSKGTKINYRVYLPADYNAETKYPLILFLHGAGQRGSNNESQLELGICEAFKDPDSEIYNCVVIAPQCPDDDRWVGVLSWGNCDYSTKEVAETASLAAVAELVERAPGLYSVDANRIYVTGISMGGYGTWDLLVRHTELFAAAIPVCGGADYRMAAKIRKIPIWTFHGKKDEVVPCWGTEKMVEKLQEKEGKITYTPYPDGGHVIWADVYARTDILPWLLSQNANQEDEEVEGGDSEPVVVTPTDPAPQPGKTEPAKKGCGGTVGGALPLAILTAAVATAATKKTKKKEK